MARNRYALSGCRSRGRCERQQGAPIAWPMSRMAFAGQDRSKPGGNTAVIVETQDGIRLGERVSELPSVTLREASNGHHGLGPAGALQISSCEHCVDRVLLGCLDETAGIDQHRIRLERISHEPKATAVQLCRKFLGVNVVARTTECDEVHCRRL
jgi:hypothetical protein